MKILCLLLALAMTISIPVAPQPDSTSAVEYVTNNFEEFISEYNKLELEDCNATSIEYQTEIYINDYDVNGHYIDFNGNNGFCVVTDDAIVDMYVTGDYPQLREKHEYMYDIMDGFFIKESEEYVPYLQHAIPELDENAFVCSAENSVKITNPDQYIKKLYGASYSQYSGGTKRLLNFTLYKQSDLSVYLTRKNGQLYSEGNCVLSSVYTTLSYLQKTGVYPKLPTGTTTLNMNNDVVKNAAQKKGYFARNTYVTVPTLYVTIRKIAIEKYGYTASGLSMQYTDDLIRDTLKYYGYNPTIKNNIEPPLLNQQMYETGFESAIKRNIQKGYPVVFNTYSVYGGEHSITIFGYKNYRRAYDLGLFKIYRYAKLLIVSDNHTKQPTYFDYTRYLLNTNYVYFK